MVVSSDAIVDLSGYDVVVVQEGFNSGSDIFEPGDLLELGNISVPLLYNKTFKLRNGRALNIGGGTISKINRISITVDPANQSNELFSAEDYCSVIGLMLMAVGHFTPPRSCFAAPCPLPGEGQLF
jgi:hypothetical protein